MARKRSKGYERRKKQRQRAKYSDERRLLRSCQKRAKEKGLLFSLRLTDIIIPETCPVLGVPLCSHSIGGSGPYMPSLDRRDPKLGYVPGNIQVMSHRANQLKSDGSIEELEAVLRFLQKKAEK
jgi:hypothetical protein